MKEPSYDAYFYTKVKAKASEEYSKKLDLFTLFYYQMIRKESDTCDSKIVCTVFFHFSIFFIPYFLKFSDKNILISTR